MKSFFTLAALAVAAAANEHNGELSVHHPDVSHPETGRRVGKYKFNLKYTRTRPLTLDFFRIRNR